MRIKTLVLCGALLTGLACASPRVEETAARMWISTGGDLDSFASDERHCLEAATADATAPLDEPLFSVCMFERGWRETRGESPTVATVAPRPSVRSRVNVRAEPTTGSEVLAALAAGEKAELLGREGDWYHVRLRDGAEGYVSARWTNTIQ